jgi:mono/diheme cytochrome c family protein
MTVSVERATRFVRATRGARLFFALAALSAGVCAAQQAPAKKKPATVTAGAALYKENCAVCHGNDGKGNGPPPANSPFTEPVPDLTTLARRHNGEFPDAYVAAVLRSGVSAPDHGPAEMPVWGILFKAMAKSDQTQVTQRVANLTSYLKSIQAK